MLVHVMTGPKFPKCWLPFLSSADPHTTSTSHLTRKRTQRTTDCIVLDGNETTRGVVYTAPNMHVDTMASTSEFLEYELLCNLQASCPAERRNS
jgi:hypothetical protein